MIENNIFLSGNSLVIQRTFTLLANPQKYHYFRIETLPKMKKINIILPFLQPLLHPVEVYSHEDQPPQ